jgi:hypothetical protein
MKFADVPEDSDFLDVDGIAVVRLPDQSLIAFEVGQGNEVESRHYPSAQKAGMEGDPLTQDEFAGWLKTGHNQFDVRDDPTSYLG